MSDVQEETVTLSGPSASAVAPGRIKRNTASLPNMLHGACTSCRDAKVRCNPSLNPEQPCQRCTKLHLSCVVDKTHKRVSRRSKLDELVQEIQSIKQSVGSNQGEAQPQTAFHPFKDPGLPRLGMNSPAGPAGIARPIPVEPLSNPIIPSPVLHTPATTTLPQDPGAEPSLPRALESQPFSGEDIDYYFHKFFECYHPYMPIVRHRDPNRCYESGPLLFWTIIFIASRRYARNPTVLPFLMDAVRREIFATMTNLPLSMSSINAFILVCSWVFPDVRFINDPTALFSGVCMNASMLLGIHTGKGAHTEYSHGAVFQNDFSDEEAAYTWAGYNIIAQRVSSYLGIPPLGGLFNQAVQNVIDGRTPFHVPSGFRVLLECQKFSNHVSKTMVACLEESRGVSAHVVRLLEDEWDTVRGLICSERADDLDGFNALLVQMEIQVYYMIPLPGYDPEALKRNILRTYNTAQVVIRDALALDGQYGFLLHVPHFYFRALLASSCVIYKLLRSSYMQFIDRRAAEQSAADALTVCKRATVTDGDLPMRLGNLLGSWFELTRDSVARWHEEPVSAFSHRLSASATLDCLTRWKHDHVGGKGQAPQADGAEDPPAAGGILAEPLQNIDWSFMDDFDWNFEPGILTGT